MKKLLVGVVAWSAAKPVTAFAGALTLLGVGGALVAAMLTTPTIVPQPASYFNQNGPHGLTNNGLKPNNGVVGALELPTPTPTNSAVIYFEGSVDASLGYSTNEAEAILGSGTSSTAVTLTGNTTGQPSFLIQRNLGGGTPGSNWWNAVSTNNFTSSITSSAGSNYATGFYPFTATGGGCAREPSGIRSPTGSGFYTDPGFLCGTTPTVNVATIPGSGAQQTTGLAASLAATTCVSNSPVTGEMTVTAKVAVAHGVSPGQTYTLQGFTGTGFTGYNATYTALAGTTGTTLVGETTTGVGVCPTSPVDTSGHEGTALSGTGGTLTLAPISPTNPFLIGSSGVTSKNAQHFCGIVGEYGADSAFPGAQFASFVDDRGNALPGAPALVPWLNQGTANFTGYTLSGTQAPSTPALVVTAMNSYAISAASFNATTGFVTFTTTTSPGFIPGSEFTVSSVSPSGYSQTYAAVAGTSGTTLVGNPLSGPGGTPSAISNPGSYVSGGGLVSVIMPDMQLLGLNIGEVIAPYGTYGGTGTGGIGTYALVGNPPTTALTAKIDNGAGAAGTTLTTTSGATLLVVGSAISGAGVSAGTVITAVLGTNSFTVSPSQLVATTESMTSAGTVGSSSSPVTIFAWPLHYYSAATGTTAANPYGGVTILRTQAGISDMWSVIGSISTKVGANGQAGWGGALANVSMLWGQFPQATGGAPDTTSLASLCKKTADIQSFAAANSLTVHSLYRLNDLGIWGDSGNATITGYIDGATGTSAGTATLHVLTTPYGSLAPAANETATITAPGLAGVPLGSPTIPLLSSGAAATYTVQFATGIISANLGSSGSPVTFSVGAFNPATPLANASFNGYIDNGGSSTPTLHVTSVPPGASFTGVLGNTFTGHIDDGVTIGAIGNVLTVTAVAAGSQYPVLGVGTVISGGTLSSPMTVTQVVSNPSTPGQTGVYNLSGTAQTVPALTPLFGTGVLPGPANSVEVSGLTGTIVVNMLLTDGGVNIAPTTPILVGGSAGPTVGGVPTWVINPTYYPPNLTYNLTGTLSTLVPGQYVQGATSSVGLTTPVSIIGYGTGVGGVGTYLLSNHASGDIGSSGSPAAFISTSIGDAGAVAPGPALTIRDLGAGVIFPVTDYTAGTGPLTLDGTFDTSVLGGTPTTIQAQVSLTSGGPPIAGCSACAWTNLSGYSATVRSGTIYNWNGQALAIPSTTGPFFVSVRAANGTAYATMPSLMKVGLVFDWNGEGQAGALTGNQGGSAISSFVGSWGLNSWASSFNLDQGPAVAGNWLPALTIMNASDRFGVDGAGIPLAEGIGDYEQFLTNAFGGWPAATITSVRDGIGITPETVGGVTQTQTIGVGNGSTTTWCSASKFCASAGVSVAGPLFFTAAYQTGANLAGATVAGTTLTIPAGNQTFNVPNTSGIVLGDLAPGFILNTGPVLSTCLTGCSITAHQGTYSTTPSAASTWSLTCSGACPTTAPTRADPPGGAPWPGYNIQGLGIYSQTATYTNTGFGTQLIQAGTFKVSVNGTVVCSDTSTFAYNVQSGTCTGAGVASSFVNYITGDYSITWTSAPTGAIIATWTNIISPDANSTANLSHPVGFDFFGNGSATSGPMSSIMAKTPGGVSGHVFAGGVSDDRIFTIPGYQFGSVAYTQAVSWLYGTRFPTLIPGQSASTPFISANPWRGEGPIYFNAVASGGQGPNNALSGQWAHDVATQSTFTAQIASGVLTLKSAAIGPMWEGEVIDCVTFTVGGPCPLGQSAGIYISSLASGAWGANGSTYNLVGSPADISTTQAMQNAVYYIGGGPAFYSGPNNDIPVQASNLAATTGYAPHMTNGPFAARRIAARWAALTWGGLTNPANASDPTLDRVKANASGCDTAAIAGPCFDIGNTFKASHAATMVSASATITVTGGIAAHDRPFVVGQALSCTSCTSGRFITAVSLPPTQDSAGQVGNTFTITASGTMGVSTTETLTAGCSGTSGTGSNCIDIAFTAGTTNGTYGTAWALATCGENNLNGTAPAYAAPAGVCQSNGIGSLVRTFRIGTTQATWGGVPAGNVAGSPYDDGADPLGNGSFNQSAAFTCNIVSAKVAQCVKGNLYDATAHTLTSIGQWASGSTFVSYGDGAIGTSRIASLQGYVGGQPFPLTAGSGGTNGTAIVTATGCTTATGFVLPKMDVTISGGALVNAYPSSETATQAMGLALGGGCAFAPGSGSGSITTPPTGTLEGVGGIATYNTDSNMMGDLLYDNSGFPGNPLNSFFTNNLGGYYEPGLPVAPFGQFMGAQVSG